MVCARVCVHVCYVYISAVHTRVLKIASLEDEVKGCCLCHGISWMDSDLSTSDTDVMRGTCVFVVRLWVLGGGVVFHLILMARVCY